MDANYTWYIIRTIVTSLNIFYFISLPNFKFFLFRAYFHIFNWLSCLGFNLLYLYCTRIRYGLKPFWMFHLDWLVWHKKIEIQTAWKFSKKWSYDFVALNRFWKCGIIIFWYFPRGTNETTKLLRKNLNRLINAIIHWRAKWIVHSWQNRWWRSEYRSTDYWNWDNMSKITWFKLNLNIIIWKKHKSYTCLYK